MKIKLDLTYPVVVVTALTATLLTLGFLFSCNNHNDQPSDVTNQNNLVSPGGTQNVRIEIQDIRAEFETTLRNTLPLLRNDPAYATLNGDTLVIGDLHGNLEALRYCKARVMEYLQQGKNVIFLGDLVDKHGGGYDASAECFLFAMKIKQMFPKQVIVLRGNHESTLQGLPWKGVGCAMPRWCRKNQVNFELYASCCDELPIACELSVGDRKYFVVHGGICEGLNPCNYTKFKMIRTNADLQKLKRTPEFKSLWNDGTEENVIPWRPEVGKDQLRKKFTANETMAFLNQFGYNAIIRGHDFCAPIFMHNDHFITIMSDYLNRNNPNDHKNRRILYVTIQYGLSEVKF